MPIACLTVERPHRFRDGVPQDPHASVRKEKILVDEANGSPKSTGHSYSPNRTIDSHRDAKINTSHNPPFHEHENMIVSTVGILAELLLIHFRPSRTEATSKCRYGMDCFQWLLAISASSRCEGHTMCRLWFMKLTRRRTWRCQRRRNPCL